MSATSALESGEDLENIPLVRMEDVQPDRSELYVVKTKDSSDTCVQSYNDEDSNIGSMISVQAEEVIETEESDPEIIVPDLPNKTVPLRIILEPAETKKNPDSWPTLEILPGGVIKHAEKQEDLSSLYHSGDENENENEEDDLMYACAKCPQRFKYLFCLVKHVKWHEVQKKKEKAPDLSKKKFIYLRSNKKKVISKLKTKCKVPKKS